MNMMEASSNAAWQRVLLARHAQRPTAMEYIERIFDGFMELHGDRGYGDDKAIVGGIARFNGMPVTVVAHQKGRNTKENIARNFGMPHPEGYRKSLRLMHQAEKFKRPIVCFIDTPGAYCGVAAEERGQGEAIAKCLLEMSALKVPVICIVIGEGGSGGALALGVGNSIAMQENSIYSILSPEGFATILWKDSKKCEEAAEVMKITSRDLLQLGVIDEVIGEPEGGAHTNVDEAAKNMKAFIEREMKKLCKLSGDELAAHRYEKFRSFGQIYEG